MPVFILYPLLAALGGILSGIVYEKVTDAPEKVIIPATESAGKFDFLKTIKLIGIITAGGVAIHLLMKLFKIKLFGRIVK